MPDPSPESEPAHNDAQAHAKGPGMTGPPKKRLRRRFTGSGARPFNVGGGGALPRSRSVEVDRACQKVQETPWWSVEATSPRTTPRPSPTWFRRRTRTPGPWFGRQHHHVRISPSLLWMGRATTAKRAACSSTRPQPMFEVKQLLAPRQFGLLYENVAMASNPPSGRAVGRAGNADCYHTNSGRQRPPSAEDGEGQDPPNAHARWIGIQGAEPGTPTRHPGGLRRAGRACSMELPWHPRHRGSRRYRTSSTRPSGRIL